MSVQWLTERRVWSWREYGAINSVRGRVCTNMQMKPAKALGQIMYQQNCSKLLAATIFKICNSVDILEMAGWADGRKSDCSYQRKEVWQTVITIRSSPWYRTQSSALDYLGLHEANNRSTTCFRERLSTNDQIASTHHIIENAVSRTHPLIMGFTDRSKAFFTTSLDHRWRTWGFQSISLS